MKTYLKSKQFRKIFLSYAILMIILVVIFIGIMGREVYEKNKFLSEKEYRNKMELVSQQLDDNFSLLNTTGMYLTSANWIKKVRSSSEILLKDIDVIKRKEINQEMLRYSVLLPLADSMALMLPHKQTVIDDISFWEEHRYFNTKKYGKITQATISQAVQNSKHYLSLDSLPNTKDILITKRLDYSNKPELVIVFYIKASSLEKIPRQHFDGDLVSFSLIQKGNISYPVTDSKHSSSRKLFTLDIPSVHGWHYSFTIIPHKQIKVAQILTFSGGLIALLILGSLLAFFLAKISYLPVYKILQKIDIVDISTTNTAQEYVFIEETFQKLYKEKKDLEQLSYEYYSVARHNLLQSILQGENNKHSPEVLHQYAINFTNDMRFITGIISSSSKFKNNYLKEMILLNDVVTKDYSKIILNSIEIQQNSLIIILGGVFSHTELIDTVNAITNNLRKRNSQRLIVTLGPPYIGIDGISKSYHAAKKQITTSELSKETPYYYPIDAEINLVNLLKTGQTEEMKKKLLKIRNENIRRKISPEMTVHVTSIIFETFFRIANSLDLGVGDTRSEFQAIKSSTDNHWLWNYLIGFAEVISKRLEYFAIAGDKDISLELVEYVSTNFRSSNLSQQLLAHHFSLSQSSISKIFKQATNVNFTDYVRVLRISEAKRIFATGEIEILTVALKVGYENETTFIRAFTRVESTSPRDYLTSNGYID